FRQEVIGSVGLFFVKGIAYDAIELPRWGKIRPERFFDDYSSPTSFAGLVQAGGIKMLENRLELIGRRRKIKKAVAAGAVVFIDFIKTFSQRFVTGFVFELALMVKDRLRKVFPDFIAHALSRKITRGFF